MSSPVKKSKGEESSEEAEAKQHKVLDDRDVDKIEDRHKLNTKRARYGPSQFKRLVRGLEFQWTILKNVLFNTLYFSAEKHYEWKQMNCKKTDCVKLFFVLASSRVISGIIERVPSTRTSPFRTNQSGSSCRDLCS